MTKSTLLVKEGARGTATEGGRFRGKVAPSAEKTGRMASAGRDEDADSPFPARSIDSPYSTHNLDPQVDWLTHRLSAKKYTILQRASLCAAETVARQPAGLLFKTSNVSKARKDPHRRRSSQCGSQVCLQDIFVIHRLCRPRLYHAPMVHTVPTVTALSRNSLF